MKDTTAVGSTDTAASTITTAVQAEQASDAEVADKLAAANDAATAANNAIADAEQAAKDLANNPNPSPNDIQNAQDAIDAANKAIATANDAKDAYTKAATDAGEDVQNTTAVGSTQDAQNTKDTAVAAEEASDKAVADLHSTANDAAEAANQAIADAQDAADKLAANNNPTAEDIQAAKDAVAQADAAIAKAQEAKAAYESAAKDAGEDVKDTTAVGSTDTAHNIVDNVQLNIAPDATDDTATQQSWSDNLIVNGNAESGESGWTTDTGDLRVSNYASNDWADKDMENTTDGNYFYGHGAEVVAHQDIDISNIDGNEFKLSADMGAYAGQTDSAELKVIFKDVDGNVLDESSTGKVVTASTMENHEVSGAIPEGATTATIEMHMERHQGGDADGYFDNMSFVVGNSAEALTTDEDSAITIDVLANDTDADGDTLSITKIEGQDVTDGQEATIADNDGNTLGTASLTADGKVNFSPSEYLQEMNDGENQDVTFSYTVSDGKAESTASVTVNVTGSNDDIAAEVPTLKMNIQEVEVEHKEEDKDHHNNKFEPHEPHHHHHHHHHDEVIKEYGHKEHEHRGEHQHVENTQEGVIEGTSSWDKVSGSKHDDNLHIGDNVEVIKTGAGNDNVIAGDGVVKMKLGSGDDIAKVGDAGRGYAHIHAGKGDDTIIAGNDFNSVDLGAGNDKLNIGDASNGWAKIDGGKGDDIINVGHGFDRIDGGKGEDTVVLKGNENEWNITEQWGHTYAVDNDGNRTELVNIEHIEYGNKDFLGDEHRYDISLKANLTDTDGSETLSDIRLDNLPEGVRLQDSSGNELSSNDDGSYTITPDSNGDATITMIASTQLDASALNNISSSVTATESSGGATMTHTESGDGLSGLIMDGNMNLDLGTLGDNVDNLQTLDMHNGNQNNISLSLEDVLDATNDENVLRIDGDTHDAVTLNTDSGATEWSLGDFKTDKETGTTYQEYTADTDDGSSVTVEINTDIQVDQS